MLHGNKILVGVTGSIAAYKTAMLIRLLVKEGAEIRVVMTPLAKEFITPLTLATLSKNAVIIDFFNPENGQWNSHVDLGLWADAYVIAPATANTIAKMACGIADNLLLTTYLSSRCPVFVAPAMDVDMLGHPATQKNIEILRSIGNIILEPLTGELASGLTGKGRMAEPEAIVSALADSVGTNKKKNLTGSLSGKKIIVTAGPTYEPIDPVRFIGNHSSGKMGIAIANELDRQGANVTLICGPVAAQHVHPSIEMISIQTAEEMHDHCMQLFPTSDGAILAAAVADYKPKKASREKIKKKNGDLFLELDTTVDIAAKLGKIKSGKQFLVGFALETSNEMQHAREKLKRKNFDFIVLNSLNDKGAGFSGNMNKVTIIDQNNKTTHFELKTKKEVAFDVISYLAENLSC